MPRRLEVAFGSERAAPELQRGLDLGDGLRLSGKIDRIDVDPFSARGIVQDYKSGKGAHSARDIDRELRLQIPLYVLALRDLVGVEPLGGLYRALSGKRLTRGMLRESAREDLPGFAKDDYLDEDAFWAQIETARERAARTRTASAPATCGTTRRATAAPRGAISGRSAGFRDHERGRRAHAPERRAARRGRGAAARSSSPRAPVPGRRRCSSSATSARSASEGSTSTRSWSSPTRERRRASCARGFEPRSSSAIATTSPASSTAPGSRRSTASATGC